MEKSLKMPYEFDSSRTLDCISIHYDNIEKIAQMFQSQVPQEVTDLLTKRYSHRTEAAANLILYSKNIKKFQNLVKNLYVSLNSNMETNEEISKKSVFLSKQIGGKV